jgi:hypothetical protein
VYAASPYRVKLKVVPLPRQADHDTAEAEPAAEELSEAGDAARRSPLDVALLSSGFETENRRSHRLGRPRGIEVLA